MPDWCSIVKVLAVRLKHNPSLFQFFIFDTDDDDEDDDDYDYDNKATEGNDADKSGVTGGGITSSKVSFPLYTTSVKLACSKYAETDYMCWTECMCSVVNVIGMKIDAVRRIVTKGVREQRMILKMLRDRLSRSIESVESALQSPSSLRTSLSKLEDILYLLNDILLCGNRSLNVLICEGVLKEVCYEGLLKKFLLLNINQKKKSAAHCQNTKVRDKFDVERIEVIGVGGAPLSSDYDNDNCNDNGNDNYKTPPPRMPRNLAGKGGKNEGCGVHVSKSYTILASSPEVASDCESSTISSKNSKNPGCSVESDVAADTATSNFSLSSSRASNNDFMRDALPGTPGGEFPGKIVGKREIEGNFYYDNATPDSTNGKNWADQRRYAERGEVKCKVQYRVRWRGDPDDGKCKCRVVSCRVV